MQRRLLDTLQRLQRRAPSRRAPTTRNLAARIASYEMAFSMQRHAPEAVDLAQETRGRPRRSTAWTTKRTEDFGRRCLLARRLVERGVRFVQLYAGGAHNDDNWDAHGDLDEEPQLPRRPHRQADRRPAQGPEAARPARRDAGHLGRRVRPPADRRVRRGHRPRPQRLRLHDVDGRRRHQGRRQRRRDRRARRRRRHRPLPRQEPARHGPAPDGPRPRTA